MSMYANGPVSTRRAVTVRASGSTPRSDTHDQVRPCSSGCIVRRNTTRFPSRSSTSAAAYSLNRFGQLGSSLVISQTRSIGASMAMLLSVCPGMIGVRSSRLAAGLADLGEAVVDGVEELPDGRGRLGVLGQADAAVALDDLDEAEQGERVDAEVLEDAVAVDVRGHARRLGEQAGDVVRGEGGGGHGSPFIRRHAGGTPPSAGRAAG